MSKRPLPLYLVPCLLCGLTFNTVACNSGEAPKPDTTKTAAASALSGKTRALDKRTIAAHRPAAKKPQQKKIPAPDDVAKPPADAKKTKSGLVSKVLQAGTGKESPTPDDRVKVHYSGWTLDGAMFDSSVSRGRPAEFGVKGVIKGWTEGLQLMTVGEKRRMWIPADLAYGKKARMGTPSGDLTFDVELLEIIKPPEPPPVPTDVAGPPADAKKTKSGLSYKLLSPGKGKRKPGAEERVRVHYSGWTKDGKMFDSSVSRGRPATFSLAQVIKGWTEGLQLMHEGDKMRFWIPGGLAYGDKPKRPGAPSGQLTFDIELLEIL